jgi:hypothetical protein
MVSGDWGYGVVVKKSFSGAEIMFLERFRWLLEPLYVQKMNTTMSG